MIYKVILFLTIIGLSLSAECHGKPGDPAINLNPILKTQPQLLQTHKYGKLFEVGSGTSKMKLLHVYGDMYQMGFAHGSLLKTELNQMMTEVWEHLKIKFQDAIPKKVPAFLKKPAAGVFIATALDLTYEITSPYTNRKYYEEMRGIADGSGVSLRLLRRIHMIGELTKGTCSMFGAWGKATLGESLIQLRALDWDVDGPFWKYPLVTIYHPSSKKYGNSWANVGFYGWLGVISGANAQKLAISEIGVYFNDQTFGKESRFGNPFTFVLRDILQWDKTLNESISRLKSAKRTCNLILGVGDGKSNEFRSFQYSHSVLNVINDTHLLPKNDTWHPVVENVVYYAMDWMCPAYNQRLYDLLTEYHGKITIENTISHIAPGVKSGNLQSVVYDVANEWMYVSYGIVNQSKKVVNAYERPFLAFNLRQLFSQPMPASS